MKKNNSPLSKVSHLATNATNDKEIQKENSEKEEVARKYWESVINPTSQEKTTSSNAKEDQTKASH